MRGSARELATTASHTHKFLSPSIAAEQRAAWIQENRRRREEIVAAKQASPDALARTAQKAAAMDGLYLLSRAPGQPDPGIDPKKTPKKKKKVVGTFG